jgi:hypothetical protein
MGVVKAVMIRVKGRVKDRKGYLQVLAPYARPVKDRASSPGGDSQFK